MENKVNKTELLAEFNERFNELDELKEVEEMIQDNTIEFPFEEQDYRVRKPGRRERNEIKNIRIKEKNKLLKESGNITEEELIQMYLNRETPIDIPKMRQQIKDLQHKIDKLAVVFIETPIDSEKKKIEAECQDLQMEQLELIYKIDDCLNTSVEKQLKSFVQEYMIYLCLEKRIESNWERHYKSYDAFMDVNDEKEDQLVYKATWYFAVLINKDD